MIKWYLQRREKQMSNETDNTLISNLKGRVSKALNTKLATSEISGLQYICDAIDTFILSKRGNADINKLNESLQLCSKLLNETKKEYIKKHIIPLLNKVSMKKWGANG